MWDGNCFLLCTLPNLLISNDVSLTGAAFKWWQGIWQDSIQWAEMAKQWCSSCKCYALYIMTTWNLRVSSSAEHSWCKNIPPTHCTIRFAGGKMWRINALGW
jgi:hypothetical protein